MTITRDPGERDERMLELDIADAEVVESEARRMVRKARAVAMFTGDMMALGIPEDVAISRAEALLAESEAVRRDIARGVDSH